MDALDSIISTWRGLIWVALWIRMRLAGLACEAYRCHSGLISERMGMWEHPSMSRSPKTDHTQGGSMYCLPIITESHDIYDFRSPLVGHQGTVMAQRYISDILCLHILLLHSFNETTPVTNDTCVSQVAWSFPTRKCVDVNLVQDLEDRILYV